MILQTEEVKLIKELNIQPAEYILLKDLVLKEAFEE